MAALGNEEALCEEACAIHGNGKIPAGLTGKDLYVALDNLNSTALCLSRAVGEYAALHFLSASSRRCQHIRVLRQVSRLPKPRTLSFLGSIFCRRFPAVDISGVGCRPG